MTAELIPPFMADRIERISVTDDEVRLFRQAVTEHIAHLIGTGATMEQAVAVTYAMLDVHEEEADDELAEFDLLAEAAMSGPSVKK